MKMCRLTVAGVMTEIDNSHGGSGGDRSLLAKVIGRTNHQGFSLIELVFVVAIISVIAMLSLNVVSSKHKAGTQKIAQSDIMAFLLVVLDADNKNINTVPMTSLPMGLAFRPTNGLFSAISPAVSSTKPSYRLVMYQRDRNKKTETNINCSMAGDWKWGTSAQHVSDPMAHMYYLDTGVGFNDLNANHRCDAGELW